MEKLTTQKSNIYTTVLSLFVTLVLVSCNDVDKAKYKKGDVVYLKPDCREGVIWDVNMVGYMYSISLDPEDWTCIKVDEEQIYGTNCPK